MNNFISREEIKIVVAAFVAFILFGLFAVSVKLGFYYILFNYVLDMPHLISSFIGK